MNVFSIKTRRLHPPQDNIYGIIDANLDVFQERDVLCISSKIVAIHQGRSVPIDSIEKDELILREAERFVPRSASPAHVMITLKRHILIPSSGIDESNANGYYILWPEPVNTFARELVHYVCKARNIKHFAVVITDSHTIPLRSGTLGIAVGFYGFAPTYDYRKRPDLFGRPYVFSQLNILDSLAVSANLVMGEGDECTPLAIVRDCPHIQFCDEDRYNDIVIHPEEDIYWPLLQVMQKGSKKSEI